MIIVYIIIAIVVINLIAQVKERSTSSTKDATLERINERAAKAEEIRKVAAATGDSFERKIQELCEDILPHSVVLRNLILPTGKYLQSGNERSKEIDLVVLSEWGNFVIEAKGYHNCFIQGDMSERRWNVNYRSGKQKDLYSPVFQARSGLEVLKKHLPNFMGTDFVVIDDSATLNISGDVQNEVFSFSDLVDYLYMVTQCDREYSLDYVQKLSKEILSLDRISKEEHVAALNSLY